jgi:trans-2,3-dihydro-3-hydroxyanthranilate isomerase
VPNVLAPVGEHGALARARPDYAAIESYLDRFGAVVLYVAHCLPREGRARARAFAHTAAMGEDPATGSAAAPLCAYLARRAGIEQLEIAQGLEMGRPSRLSCRLEGGRVRVSGGAAVVFEGTVSL